MDWWCRTSAPGVARGLPWGPRGIVGARTRQLRRTKDTGGGGGGRYERQRQHREELLAAASRRDRPGRRSPFKVSPGKRGKSLQRSTLRSPILVTCVRVEVVYEIRRDDSSGFFKAWKNLVTRCRPVADDQSLSTNRRQLVAIDQSLTIGRCQAVADDQSLSTSRRQPVAVDQSLSTSH